MKIYSALAAIFLGCFWIAACSSEFSSSASQKKASSANGKTRMLRVSGYIAVPDSTSGTYTANGELVAKAQVDLKAEASGKLVKLYAKDGQKVSKGTLLAKLDDAELQANLKSAKTALDLAEKKAARTKTLYGKDGATAEELESAESAVESAKASKELIEAQLQKTEVRAPFAGTLGVVEVSEGAWMTSGAQIATLTNTSELKVEFELPQRFSRYANMGDKVVLIDTEQGIKADAKICFLDATMSNTSRTRKARALLKNANGKFLPGTYVRVKLDFGEGELVGIPVPSEAVTLDANGAYVFVVKDGKAKKVDVQTGLRTPITVDVVQGLSAGDTVVASGLMNVRDGMGIEIKEFSNNMSYGVNE